MNDHRYGVAVWGMSSETFPTYEKAKAFLDRIPHRASLFEGPAGEPLAGKEIDKNNGREATQDERLAALRHRIQIV